MKAVVYTKYGSPEVLQLMEIKTPTPKDNEVLIKIYATTVTATDCTFRKGKPFISRFSTGITKPKFSIPGSELSGEVKAVGNNVKRFKVGDKVYGTTMGNGTYAQYICLPEEASTLSIKPSNLTYEEAATCDGALTALPFLRDKGKIQSGQEVLIYGASGSVGTAAVQLASYFGAEVTAVCSSTNQELVKSLGAHKVIDYIKDDFTKNGRTYDIIFDTVGKISFKYSKSSLKKRGVFLEAAITSGIIPQMLWTSMFSNKNAIIAFTGLRPPSERTKDLMLLKELIETEKIKPVIDRQYPLEEIVEAHRYVEKGHKRGNVVINVNHENLI